MIEENVDKETFLAKISMDMTGMMNRPSGGSNSLFPLLVKPLDVISAVVSLICH